MPCCFTYLFSEITIIVTGVFFIVAGIIALFFTYCTLAKQSATPYKKVNAIGYALPVISLFAFGACMVLLPSVFEMYNRQRNTEQISTAYRLAGTEPDKQKCFDKGKPSDKSARSQSGITNISGNIYIKQEGKK